MRQRILIEPDATSARIVVARGSGRVWTVADAFQADLPSPAGSDEVAESVRNAMQLRGIRGRCELDLIAGRRDIELRELQLPPAPDDELPELVRFAARNEFTHFSDSALLDFMPLRGDANSARTVVAAVLNPGVAEQAERLAAALGLKLRRILVRPWCLAAAVADQLEPGRTSLIACQTGESADLIGWHGGNLQLTRNVRLGYPDQAATGQELGDEIQRTLILVSRAAGGRPVDDVLLIGDPRGPGLEQRAGWPAVRTIAPGADGGSRLDAAKGAVFAAQIGALRSLGDPQFPQLDFLNPRRTRRRGTDWRKAGLWGGVAAAILAGLGFLSWQTLATQGRTIASLNQQLKTLTDANQPKGNRPGVDQIIGEVALVDEWASGATNWLEELAEVSDRMLTPDDAIVDSWTGSVAKGNTSIVLTGHMNDRETGTDVQTRLASRPYRITPGQTRIDQRQSEYPFSFSMDLTRPLDVVAKVREMASRAAGGLPGSAPEPPSAASPPGSKPPDGPAGEPGGQH